MLKATLYRCAVRHHSIHRLLIFLFQCICVVTLFSTACYIVDIRSRYPARRRDFPALASYSECLWDVSALPRPTARAPGLQWPAIQTREVPFSGRERNTSEWRTAAVDAAALEDYGLEKVECLWSMHLGPTMTTTTTTLPIDTLTRHHASSVAQTPPHLHIFFLHGNAGSHTQGEYWSCAVQQASDRLGVPISTYAVQWAEQANVHRGRLVGLQADFVADVVEATVRRAMAGSAAEAAEGRRAHRVWLVGHSMGGVVARLTAQLLDPALEVGGIVTFNSPHRFPPLLLDAPMAAVYRALAHAEQAAGRPLLTNGAGAGGGGAAAALLNAPLSSATLLRLCGHGAAEEACRKTRRRQRRASHLITLTSGEMDLQIEPATTLPAPWSGQYVVKFVNTLGSAACNRSASHDGVLQDPCIVTLGALQLLSAALGAPETHDTVPTTPTTTFTDNASSAETAVLGGTQATQVSAQAQLPLPPGLISRVSLIGQLLWQQHMWPWAVVALYGYVLLAGLWPLLVLAAEALLQRWSTRRGLGRQCRTFLLLLRWVESSEFSVVIFLVFFYSVTCVYAALTALGLAVTGWREAYSVVHPWQWAVYPQLRHTAVTVAAPLQFATLTFFFVLLSIGPVTVGINAGMALLVMGDMTRRIKAKVGRCQGLFGTVRRRRTAAVVFPLVVAVCYFGFCLCRVNPTTRAMAWLGLFLLLPCLRHTPAGGHAERTMASTAADAALPKRDADAVEIHFPADVAPARGPSEIEVWHAQHLPGMLYAALYLLQLHPFFTIRNAVVSHTDDGAAMVDGRVFVAEAGLLVLLCCAATGPSLLRPLLMCRSRLLGHVSLLSGAVSLTAVAWMLVRPVESFQVLPALLWCFPSFLISTLST